MQISLSTRHRRMRAFIKKELYQIRSDFSTFFNLHGPSLISLISLWIWGFFGFESSAFRSCNGR